MAEATKIQWTDHTFNPWIGCTKVHAGCANCYAEADMDKRRGRVQWGPNGTRSKTSEQNWREPLKWANAKGGPKFCCTKCGVWSLSNRSPGTAGVSQCCDAELRRFRVFCASLADVFEDWDGPIYNHKGEPLNHQLSAPVDNIAVTAMTMDHMRTDLFRLIDATPNLDWLLLTKRPENVRRMWSKKASQPTDEWCNRHLDCRGRNRWFYRHNVWLLTSVSDQETADRMIPELLKCRDLVPVLGASAEPLLGPIDWSQWMTSIEKRRWLSQEGANATTPSIDWVIFGGESGLRPRPCTVKWIEDGVRQCREAGVPAFVKQLGGNPMVLQHPFGPCQLELKDKKGGDPSEWPEDLRVREFPNGCHSKQP